MLVVGGVHYKTHSHKMAVGSEVHVVARTEPGVTEEGVAAEEECKQDKGQASARRSTQNQKIPPTPSLSIFASLHRKLIVQQVRNSWNGNLNNVFVTSRITSLAQ